MGETRRRTGRARNTLHHGLDDVKKGVHWRISETGVRKCGVLLDEKSRPKRGYVPKTPGNDCKRK